MADTIPLEKTIVNQIMKWLKDVGGYTFLYKSHGSAYARAGLPDIVVIDKGGRFVGLECKRPRVGRLTILQAKVLNQIADSGGYAAVVTSVDDARRAMIASEAGAHVVGRFIGG